MKINKCRACLKETFSQLLCWTAPIETGKRKSITYLECFKMCTRLGAKEHDKLPQTLCFQCAAELRFTHKFIKKATESLEILLINQEEFVKVEENRGPPATQNEFMKIEENQEPTAAREVFIKMEENGEPFIPKEINKCRVCLVTTLSQLLCWTTPLESADHESITYLECFEMCTRLGASKHDQLPQTLCYQCAAELRFAYKFIKKAIRFHEILLMKQEELKKIEKNEEPAATQEKFINVAAQPSVAFELQKRNYHVRKTQNKMGRKLTKNQKRLLLIHIKANPTLDGFLPKGENSKESWENQKKIWRKIAVNLNTKGPIKTGPQWKQVWYHWKYKVKRQYTSIKHFEAQIQAGLELPSSDKPKKLNEMDEEVLFFAFKDKGRLKKRGFQSTKAKEDDDVITCH